MSLQIGQQLGSYEITSLIGKGGMGEVYRARDSKLKRDVAIKALPDEFSRDHDRLIRFQREAEVLASLNHSNIASIYDLQEANESRFLIMELVEGETLAERISRGPLPLEETLDIAKQICDALEATHEKGIIHRDLKPGNVKILPDGKVKVLDFGLAKSMETVPASTASSNSPTLMSVAVTNAAVILGTAAYMSPEQAKGMNVDRRTDIFAFGAVVYEMLTGSQAFPGETVGDILAAVIRGEPDWSRLPVETSATLQRLLRHCLQKDPKRRFHDIANARIELEAFVLTTGFTTLASSPSMSTARRSQRAVALAVLAIAGLLATWILGREFYGARTAGDGVAYRASIPIPEGMSLFGGIASPLRLALSSDGRQIAFVISESASNRRGLWVRKVDEATARPLSGTEGADSPFWSPDGRFIAYRAQNKLWTINVSGGPPLMLADALAVPGGVGGAWNRDDVILFTPKSGAPLHRIAASGGTSVPVTKLDMEYGENTHRFPHFLPDGRHFLYLAAGSKSGGPNDPHGLFVASLDPNEPARKVSSQGVNAQFALDHLIFVRDGTLVAQLFDTRQMQLLGGQYHSPSELPLAGISERQADLRYR